MYIQIKRASLVAQTVEDLPAVKQTWVQSLGQEDPLEEGMATHSSILAWRILWTGEPGGPQSMWPHELNMTERLQNTFLKFLNPKVAKMVKNPPGMWETWVRSLGWDDPLEEGMATHSSILAWRIPQTEEPGRLQSIGSQRVGHD